MCHLDKALKLYNDKKGHWIINERTSYRQPTSDWCTNGGDCVQTVLAVWREIILNPSAGSR